MGMAEALRALASSCRSNSSAYDDYDTGYSAATIRADLDGIAVALDVLVQAMPRFEPPACRLREVPTITLLAQEVLRGSALIDPQAVVSARTYQGHPDVNAVVVRLGGLGWDAQELVVEGDLESFKKAMGWS